MDKPPLKELSGNRGSPDAPGTPAALGEAFDFPAVVARFQTPLLRYVRHLHCEGWDQAQDIVQDVFLRLHRQVGAQGPASIGNLSTWLYRVAHNAAMDAGRKRSAAARMAKQTSDQARERLAQADNAPGALGELEHKEACDKALAELDKLPEEHKQLLLLRVTQEMTLRQVSQITGLSIGNAAYRINQALALLTRRLKESGVI
jgi:RNA polymerase sigma factor (sigma-70 family)